MSYPQNPSPEVISNSLPVPIISGPDATAGSISFGHETALPQDPRAVIQREIDKGHTTESSINAFKEALNLAKTA